MEVVLDTNEPIDVDGAIKIVGDAEIFYKMAGRMESLTLHPVLSALAPLITQKNYAQIKQKVHSLKGSCGYAGAARVHWCCKTMQRFYVENQMSSMLDLYPYLIEAAHEFKVFLAQVLEEKRKPLPRMKNLC